MMPGQADCGIRRDEFQSTAPSVRHEADLAGASGRRNAIKPVPSRVPRSRLSLSLPQFFSRRAITYRATRSSSPERSMVEDFQPNALAGDFSALFAGRVCVPCNYGTRLQIKQPALRQTEQTCSEWWNYRGNYNPELRIVELLRGRLDDKWMKGDIMPRSYETRVVLEPLFRNLLYECDQFNPYYGT